MIKDKAIVLFSGGQDSATCLAWCLSNFAEVETVGFNLGQRHAIEMEVRFTFLEKFKAMFPRWKPKIGEDFVLNLSGLEETLESAQAESLSFLTIAASLAVKRGAKHIVMGGSDTDNRDNSIKAMQVALNLGLNERLVLHTPLMWQDKCETWRSAEELGGLKFVSLIEEETHSCTFGERGTRHDWGYGCDTCPSCSSRKIGYNKYKGT